MARLQRIDTVDGGTLTESQDGYECVRVCWVDNLTGRADARLYNAVRAAGVPRLGDPHPSIPDLRVVERSAAPEKGNDLVIVTITYRIPQANEAPPSDPAGATSAGVVRVGSTVQEQKTERDAFGEPIKVEHTYPADWKDPELAGQTIPQITTVELEIPQLVLTETRRERGTPANKARAFVGKVNRFAIWGGAARTWLCTKIEGETKDHGLTYEVAYEFQYNETGGGWDTEVAFRDPKTDREVEGLVEGVGKKTVQVYQVADFGTLGLSL